MCGAWRWFARLFTRRPRLIPSNCLRYRVKITDTSAIVSVTTPATVNSSESVSTRAGGRTRTFSSKNVCKDRKRKKKLLKACITWYHYVTMCGAWRWFARLFTRRPRLIPSNCLRYRVKITDTSAISEQFRERLYTSKWEDKNIQFQKCLSFMLLETLTPVTVSCHGITNASMASFQHVSCENDTYNVLNNNK
ncbi:hypothetical protein J6590_085378 [Homalodisca vitripennis]|nr:hypothetical protein J6590_085378 [Homalodisca vitripennis]